MGACGEEKDIKKKTEKKEDKKDNEIIPLEKKEDDKLRSTPKEKKS